MSESFSDYKEAVGQSSKRAFEVTFNIHVDRMNERFMSLVSKGGIQTYELLALYGGVRILNGLILAGNASREFRDTYREKMDMLRELVDLTKIANVTEDAFALQEAYFMLLEVYEWQLQEMSPMGLVPPDEVEDYWPTFVPKTISDEDYVIKEGDLDYQKQYTVSTDSEGTSHFGDGVARNP